MITCHLNDTATFTVMNVTYLKFGAPDVQQIAFIDEINGVTMLKMEDIVSISMSNKVINITILNPSCENEGIFAVVTDINGESIKDQGKFSMISEYPVLKVLTKKYFWFILLAYVVLIPPLKKS